MAQTLLDHTFEASDSADRIYYYPALNPADGLPWSPSGLTPWARVAAAGGEPDHATIAFPAASPLWWDFNHIDPGPGPLNILASLYKQEWTGHGILPNVTDIRGHALIITARVRNNIKPASVRYPLMIQSRCGGDVAFCYLLRARGDHALGFGAPDWDTPSRVDAVKNSGWCEISFVFSSDPADYEPLGCRRALTQVPNGTGTRYGALPDVTTLLTNWGGTNTNMAWLATFPNQDPVFDTYGDPVAPAEGLSGALDIKRLRWIAP